MARSICRTLLMHTAFFAVYFAFDTAGNNRAARSPMIAITTNSSIEVKAMSFMPPISKRLHV